jgi:hypothetical protein
MQTRTGCRMPSPAPPTVNTVTSASSQPPFTPHEAPPPTENVSPPAKRTQKAARRRCEVELLREMTPKRNFSYHLSTKPAKLHRICRYRRCRSQRWCQRSHRLNLQSACRQPRYCQSLLLQALSYRLGLQSASRHPRTRRSSPTLPTSPAHSEMPAGPPDSACFAMSRRGLFQEDKRMVLEHTHGLFIT